MEKLEAQCFICGNFYCQEEPDHKKMTFIEFDNLLKTKAGYRPEIAKIKHKIRKCYKQIEKLANQSLQHYMNELFLMVDKLHFWHLLRFSNCLKDIQAVIFGFMLPRNQMVRLLNFLNREPDQTIVFPKFDKLLYQIHKFKKITKKVIERNNYGQLLNTFVNIIQECENQFNSSQLAKRVQTFSVPSNAAIPILQAQEQGHQFVLIQGVPFSTMRNSMDLSILQLTDGLLLDYLPSLQKMKNLRDLQIRNNRISERGYRMLFNALPDLQSLDASCSNSKALYKILGDKLPNIKTLYLNESSLNDEKLISITEKLENLRVLFADVNQVTSKGVSQLFNKRKNIIYASMKGNGISKECGTVIQVNLAYKGGYLQY